MNLFQRLTWHTTPFAAAVVMLFAIRTAEITYFPVVTNFTVTNLESVKAGVRIQGTMEKVRDCEFLQLTAYINGNKPVDVDFLDRKGRDTTRIVGYQLWGPWDVDSQGAKTVQIYSRHQCHLLWQQQQKLADFSIS